MIKLSFSEKAKTDLEGIFLYLNSKNPQAAIKTVREIRKSVNLLVDLPKIGRVRPEINSQIRSFNKNKYYIFYSYHEDSQIVEIVRIWDTRQDLNNMEF